MAKYGPHAQLTANTENWGGYYIEEVRKVINGTWTGGRRTIGGVKENMIVLTPLNPSIPPDLVKLFNDRKQAVIDGKLNPFAGPIKDNSGVTKVAAGSTLTDQQLMTLDWYVEGVEGSVPR